jgi:hypothetical protein
MENHVQHADAQTAKQPHQQGVSHKERVQRYHDALSHTRLAGDVYQ